MFVSGPVATRVTAPGAAETCLMRKSTACSATGAPRAAASVALPRPDSPCTWRASLNGRSSGAGLPAATGSSGWPRNSSTASALAVVRSRPTFPATVVTPARSRPGCPQPNAIAKASSMPGSQSRMTRRGAPSGGSGGSSPRASTAGLGEAAEWQRAGLAASRGSPGRDSLLWLEGLQRQDRVGDAGYRLPQGGTELVGQRRPVGAAAGRDEGDPLDRQVAEGKHGHTGPPGHGHREAG